MVQVETMEPALRFSVIRDGWRLYKQYWLVWSGTMVVAILCDMLAGFAAGTVLRAAGMGMFGGFARMGNPHVPFSQLLGGVLISGFFLGSMLRMGIRQVRGHAPRVEDLFHVSDVWFDLLLGSALIGITILVGWLLFVLPGMIAAGLLMLALPLIVDSGMPATGAMIRSWDVMKSQWLPAAVLHFALAAIAGFGFMLGGIGLLVTGPIYVLSIATLYHEFFPYGESGLRGKAPGFDEDW